jgi:hypothetical protein
MLILLALAGTYAGWRVVLGAWTMLRNLPRSNDDLVFW